MLEAMCLPSINITGDIDFEVGLNLFQQWALDKGHIDAALTEDQFFDNSFIEHANQYLEKNTP